MTNEQLALLQAPRTRQVMHAYFTHTAALLCCRPNARRSELSRRLLELTLEIYDATELLDLCQQILEQTEIIRTAADARLLDLADGTVPEPLHCFCDMRAAALAQPELPPAMSMDASLLPEVLEQAVMLGHPWALRLSACMNWLESTPPACRENAIRLWRLLSCTGDGFALAALAHGHAALGQPEEGRIWAETAAVFHTARRQLRPTASSTDGSKEARERANLILAIHSSLLSNGARLPLAALQYAVDSTDPLPQKIRQLCPNGGQLQLRLLEERRPEQGQYGF